MALTIALSLHFSFIKHQVSLPFSIANLVATMIKLYLSFSFYLKIKLKDMSHNFVFALEFLKACNLFKGLRMGKKVKKRCFR